MTMRWRRLGFVGIAVAAGIFAGWHVLHGPDGARAAGPAPAPQVPVTTTTTKVQNVAVYLDGLGTVQAYNVVEIKAQVNGSLTGLPAREGQEVKKGEVIAEIDPTPYKAALDQAVAQRAEDTAQLQSAQLDLQRFRTLAQRSFAPVQQVDDQQAMVNKDIAAVAFDNAAIETAQFNLNNCIIRSPIDGRVSLYQTDVGNLIEVPARPASCPSLRTSRSRWCSPCRSRSWGRCRPRWCKAECRSWRPTARIPPRCLAPARC